MIMLGNARIELMLPVVDLERAKKFYGETLGLKFLDEAGPELASSMAFFKAGEDTQVNLYLRQAATKADHTAGNFLVKNLEATVTALGEQGVAFEQYDVPGLKTDERGIASVGSFKSAWFKDTEGNILAVVE